LLIHLVGKDMYSVLWLVLSRIINYNMCVAMRYEMRVIRGTLSLVLEFDAPHIWNFLIFLY